MTGGPSLLIRWRTAVITSQVKSSARLVALVLSTHMNGEGGSCYPGIRLLVEETGLSAQTIVDAIKDLEAAGLIDVKRGAGTRSSEYQALIPSVLMRVTQGDSSPDNDDPLALRDQDRLAFQSEQQRAPRGHSEDAQRSPKEDRLRGEDLELDAPSEASRARENDQLPIDTPPSRGAYWEPEK